MNFFRKKYLVKKSSCDICLENILKYSVVKDTQSTQYSPRGLIQIYLKSSLFCPRVFR